MLDEHMKDVSGIEIQEHLLRWAAGKIPETIALRRGNRLQ